MPKRSPASEARVLLTGLAYGESPRWREGRLWFANWGAREVVAVDLAGKSEVALRAPTTFPLSIDWLPDGRLLVLSGREGRLLRREADGALTAWVDLTPLASIWNEVVVDGRGRVYVNGGDFDLMAGGSFKPGVIALVTPDGAARQVADGLAFPNGMAVTPDNATLIVAESFGRRLTAFDIGADGGLSNRRVWADLGDGAPDGLCLDAEGAVWCADVPNQRCVRVRQGGDILQAIEFDRGCFACMLGGAEGKTLFVLAAEWRGPEHMSGAARTGQVLTVEAPAPRAGWP